MKTGEPPLVLALGAAQGRWSGASFCAHAVADFSEARAILRSERPTSLLTGTSLEVLDDESFWRWAETQDIPSTALIDSWCHYGERFTRPDGRFVESWPTTIAVIDELARQGAVADGLPARYVVVTGNPGFDAMTRHLTPSPGTERGLRILFASQPLRGRGLPDAWDEHFALKTLLEAAERVGLSEVTIRLHPAEAHDAHQSSLGASTGPRLHLDSTPDRHASAAKHHVIIGIVSTFLVESSWLGRHVASIQRPPGHDTPIITGHHIPVFTETETLVRWLKEITADIDNGQRTPPGDITLGKATEAVLALLRGD